MTIATIHKGYKAPINKQTSRVRKDKKAPTTLSDIRKEGIQKMIQGNKADAKVIQHGDKEFANSALDYRNHYVNAHPGNDHSSATQTFRDRYIKDKLSGAVDTKQYWEDYAKTRKKNRLNEYKEQIASFEGKPFNQMNLSVRQLIMNKPPSIYQQQNETNLKYAQRINLNNYKMQQRGLEAEKQKIIDRLTLSRS